jgi:hypothetical protein
MAAGPRLPRARASEAELVSEAVFELGEAPHGVESGKVGVAAEGGEHAREIGCRGDRRTKTLADRLPRGRATQVVVAPARAGRLGDDPKLSLSAAEPKQDLGWRAISRST